MKTLVCFLVAIVLFFVSCAKNGPDDQKEGCIKQEIEVYKSTNIPCASGKSIYRYKFQDKFVYVFNPGNCGADMMSTVYDSECNVICGLGGIAGNTSCNGLDFGKHATDETVIWEQK